MKALPPESRLIPKQQARWFSQQRRRQAPQSPIKTHRARRCQKQDAIRRPRRELCALYRPLAASTHFLLTGPVVPDAKTAGFYGLRVAGVPYLLILWVPLLNYF